MSKLFALAAFNTAVAITNGVHVVGRAAEATVTTGKEGGVAFWAGLKYAHQANRENGVSARHLTRRDVGMEANTANVDTAPRARTRSHA